MLHEIYGKRPEIEEIQRTVGKLNNTTEHLQKLLIATVVAIGAGAINPYAGIVIALEINRQAILSLKDS